MSIRVVGGGVNLDLDKFKKFSVFVNDRLYPSLQGLGANTPLSVMLGGSHSKGLGNSRSDVDLTLYYATSVGNLLSFDRTTLSVVPRGDFTQTGSNPVYYECEGEKYELALVPARRVDRGNDLVGALHESNMKTIHDLLKDYELLRRAPREFERYEPDKTGAFDAIVEAYLRGALQIPVGSITQYFRGYMEGQLGRRRGQDFDKRERKSLLTADPNPAVKAIMNGVYIGLSGLVLLDEMEVHRDFDGLLSRFVHFHPDLLSEAELEFVATCYLVKTDRATYTRFYPGVDAFLAAARVHRESIFLKLRNQFDTSKKAAIEAGRFSVEIDQAANDEFLEDVQGTLLDLPGD